jgi:periplasmic protein TonB
MFSGLSAAQPSARRWTALASFTLQVALIAAALVFPMLYPQNLPPVFLNRRIFVPMSRGEVLAETNPAGTTSRGPILHAVLVVSRRPVSGESRPTGSGPGPEAPSLGPATGPGPDLGPLVTVSPNILPPPPVASRPPRTSVVMEGNLIHRVEPQYPAIARQIRLEGVVVLKAIISRDGNIEHLEVASGPPLLARAATEAVGRWKYRPYLLNGEPVEVETQITVNFFLGH